MNEDAPSQPPSDRLQEILSGTCLEFVDSTLDQEAVHVGQDTIYRG